MVPLVGSRGGKAPGRNFLATEQPKFSGSSVPAGTRIPQREKVAGLAQMIPRIVADLGKRKEKVELADFPSCAGAGGDLPMRCEEQSTGFSLEPG